VANESLVQRRTQEERSDSTRRRLLDATVECLVERGYAGTTTSEVQKRAGVSRGALLHHFPSRADLLTGAIRHLIEARQGGMRQAALRLPAGEERVRRVIEVLWSTFDGSLFWAAMELWLAARTDTDLRRSLLPQERWLGARIREWCDDLFGPDVAAHPNYEAFIETLLESMRGHALGDGLRGRRQRSQAPVERWVGLADALLADRVTALTGRQVG
jgi:AcrR family transcriptional regulator